MALPAFGTCIYNGYTFGVQTETVGIDLRFVYDAAGRTVAETVHTLTLKSKIAAGANQDTTLDSIRTALERPGGALQYSGRGFGAFNINTVGGKRDLAWGPKPRMLKWKPTARDYAAEIVWQCEVAILGCSSSLSSGVKEFNYKVSVDIDSGGYTKRTFTGHLVIVATRNDVNSNTVAESVDAYFDQIVPPIPTNFRREVNRREISMDRSRLDFTFTDEELPAALPPGVIRADGEHTVTNADPRNFVVWNGSVRANYELARGTPHRALWSAFLDLVEDRVRAEIAQGPSGCFAVPVKIAISNNSLYGRPNAGFSFDYFSCGAKGGKNTNSEAKDSLRWFPTGGVWRPDPNGDPNLWGRSLANGAQSPRGHAGYAYDASTDAIVDLCLTSSGMRTFPKEQVSRLRTSIATIQTPWVELQRRLQAPVKPAPAGSWLEYTLQLTVEPSDNVAVHRPLPTSSLSPAAVFIGGPAAAASGLDGFQLNPAVGPAPIIQVRGPTLYYVRIQGRALRLNYEIQQPTVQNIAGRRVTPVNDPADGNFWRTWLAGYSFWPIYAAEFNLRWVLHSGSGDGLVQALGRPDEPNNILGL